MNYFMPIKTPRESIIDLFKTSFPSYNIKPRRGVGIECEFPVVTQEGCAVSLDVIQGMFSYLESKGFDIDTDEYSGLSIAAKQKNNESKKSFHYHTDVITTDVGFSTVEVVLSPQDNLHSVQKNLAYLVNIILDYFGKHKCLILGYGIQPLESPSERLLMPKERYKFFNRLSDQHHLKNSNESSTTLLSVTASNQCHVEIGLYECITATNVLNALSGLQIALHANSPIWQGKKDPSFKSNREIFWDYCFPNRMNQVGIPPKFTNIEHYVDTLFNIRPALVKRNNCYYQITNKSTFKDYLLNESETIGCTLDGEETIIKPEVDDIQQLIPFSWFNARLVPKYGTIESRMCCQQPQDDTLTTAALTLGIIENLEDASNLMNRHSLDVWRETRELAARHAFDAHIQGKSIVPLLVKLLDIATAGLKKRNMNEEIFLEPLYNRLLDRRSPADVALDVFTLRGMTGLLEHTCFKKQVAY